MRFKEWYLDGFGIFHDTTIPDLKPGLNIFFGPNEAGKSTLHQFQNRILFGFPKGRTKANKYPPLKGGNHGGRMIVATDNNQEYLIERYVASNTEKFQPIDEAGDGYYDLHSLLGHIDENVYTNVFSFGLAQLTDFETLDNEEVKDRLYAAGAGIGRISLKETQKYLDNEADELFKPRGRKPEVNALIREIRKIDESLREIEQHAEEYDELHEKVEDFTESIKNEEEQLTQLTLKRDHHQHIIDIWDDWTEFSEAKEQLDSMKRLEDFPSDAVSQWEKINDKKNGLEQEINDLTDELERIESDLSKHPFDEQLISSKKEIYELVSLKEKFKSASKDLPKVKEQYQTEQEKLTSNLREIGKDWTMEKLHSFDSSIPAKETVRKKQHAIDDVNQEISQIKNDLAKVKKRKKGIEEEIKSLKQNQGLKEEKNSAEFLTRQQQALRSIRAKYPKYIQTQGDFNRAKDKQDLYRLFSTKKPRMMTLPLWPVWFLFIIGILAGVLVGGIGQQWIVGGGIILLLAGSAVFYYLYSKRSNSMDESEGGIDEFQSQLPSMKQDITQIRDQLQNQHEQLLSLSKIVGFDDIPHPNEIEDKEEKISQQLLKFVDVQKKQQKNESLQNELDELTDKLNENQEKWNQLHQEWNNWLDKYQLPHDLTPESVIDIFSLMQTCREIEHSIQDKEERIQRIEQSIENTKNKLSTVLKKCNREFDEKELNIIAEVELLKKDFDVAEKAKKICDELEIEQNRIEKDLNRKNEAVEKQETLLKELFDECEVSSAQELKNKAEQWELQMELEEKRREAEKRIKKISGEKAFNDFIKELEQSVPEDIISFIDQLDERIRSIKERLDELKEQGGRVKNQIDQIEKQDEGSKLRFEKSEKLQEVHEKSRKWAALQIAQTMMKKAIEQYQKERQPDVIKNSQDYFQTMTLGKYQRIYTPLDESGIHVVDETHSEKELDELSRGTAEQLYLSLRLGFIKELSKRSESIPVVFDEILVDFDPQRAQATAQMIKQLSSQNQVLFFTCHPETKQLLVKTVPDAKTIDLQKYHM